MSSERLVFRFPDGKVEWRSPAAVPAVDDRVVRGEQEWVVASVEDEGTGNARVVTVGLRAAPEGAVGEPLHPGI